MSVDRTFIFAGLLAVVLSGCSQSAVHPTTHQLVAVAAPPQVKLLSASFCNPAGAGKVAASRPVGSDRFWAAVEGADNTVHLAAQQLSFGRDDLTGSQRTVAGQFKAAAQLLHQAQSKLHSAPAPAAYSGVELQMDRVCSLSVQAINDYQTGRAEQNPQLVRRANQELKTAQQVLSKVDAELVQISAGEVARVQAEAQHEVAEIKAEQKAKAAAQAAKLRHQQVAVRRAAQRAVQQRFRLQLRLRFHIHLTTKYAILVNGKLVYVSRQRFIQWLAYQQRMENAQTRAILALRKYVLAMRRARLVYQADMRSLGSWITTGDGSWRLIRHQDPINPVHTTWFYGGNGLTTVLAPYTNRWPEFAVQARIRLAGYSGGRPEDPQGFGILVRARGPADLSQSNDGFLVGVMHLNAAPNASPPHAEISAAGFAPATTPLEPQGAMTNFNPGPGWHTYRLEVRDSQMRLVVDRKWIIAHLTTDQYYFDPGVGLFSVNSGIEVADFKVLRLPPTP